MANPVYLFFATPRSWAPALLRWVLGLQLIASSVWQTLPIIGQPNWQSFPFVLAWFVAAGGNHFFALILKFSLAIFLIAGLFTRACMICLLALISFYFFQNTSHTESQLLLITAAVCLSLLISGAGILSMDRALSRLIVPDF